MILSTEKVLQTLIWFGPRQFFSQLDDKWLADLQEFLHSTLPKIGRVRHMVDYVNPDCEIEVDGGVDETTGPLAAAAGADVFVAGSSIFGESAGVAASMNRLCIAIASRDRAVLT